MPVSLFIALQFLTVLPVRPQVTPTTDDTARSLLFYPFAGLVIGLILTLALWLLPISAPLISAALLLIIWIALTGGLHLDGLADSADAWLGGLNSKSKTLAIMKDPTCGSIAVITLIMVLLLKFCLLYTLVLQQNWLALIWAPVLARLAMPMLFLTTPYVREQGLGVALQQMLPATEIRWLLLLTTILAWFFIGLLPIIAGLAVFLFLRYLMERRLAGFTGDTAGALLELLEVSLLLFIIL